MKRDREREKRPEDEESISCARKRTRTYVGSTRRSGKKKEKERTVHSERKKGGSELSWKKRGRDIVGRKREKRREERGKEREFILAAMMVVVSELAISEQLPSLFIFIFPAKWNI